MNTKEGINEVINVVSKETSRGILKLAEESVYIMRRLREGGGGRGGKRGNSSMS